jgi:hypothetical protein
VPLPSLGYQTYRAFRLNITHAIDMLDFGVARGPPCDSIRHEMKY